MAYNFTSDNKTHEFGANQKAIMASLKVKATEMHALLQNVVLPPVGTSPEVGRQNLEIEGVDMPHLELQGAEPFFPGKGRGQAYA